MLNTYSYSGCAGGVGEHPLARRRHYRRRTARFHRAFMPESLAQTEPLSFLIKEENEFSTRLEVTLTSASSGSWKNSVPPFVLDHARTQLQGDDYRVRALLQFAGEEAKHIQLFKRFKQEFEDGFGTECQVIGPPRDCRSDTGPRSAGRGDYHVAHRVDGAASLSR